MNENVSQKKVLIAYGKNYFFEEKQTVHKRKQKKKRHTNEQKK